MPVIGMAFISMLAIYLIIILIVLAITTTIAIVLLIVSFIMKRLYKKKLSQVQTQGKVRKYYLIPRIIGWVFMIPVMIAIGLVVYVSINNAMTKHNGLGYNVMHGNYSDAERILKKGVTPDCTLKSNNPAEPGEQTILSLLCEKGFTNNLKDSIDDEETEEELKMIQLLIDYGADIERRTYTHDIDDPSHLYREESDYYLQSDNCGCTPFLHAVHMGNEKTVTLLLENGADVNAEDYCGFNAISSIADNKSDEGGLAMLRYLISEGCDKRHVTNYKQTSYFLAFRQYASKQERGNEEILKLLEE